jgi:hypothetical protein
LTGKTVGVTTTTGAAVVAGAHPGHVHPIHITKRKKFLSISKENMFLPAGQSPIRRH